MRFLYRGIYRLPRLEIMASFATRVRAAVER